MKDVETEKEYGMVKKAVSSPHAPHLAQDDFVSLPFLHASLILGMFPIRAAEWNSWLAKNPSSVKS